MRVKFSRKKLTGEILREAKVLKLHSGAAELITDKVVDAVGKWAEGQGGMEQRELDARVAKELKKYNKDLAFLYQHRGRII